MEILQHWTLIVPILMVLAVLVIYRQKRNRVRAPVDVVVKLVDKNRVSHDTFIYTFLLPEPLTGLGLKIGEHILTMYSSENSAPTSMGRWSRESTHQLRTTRTPSTC